jgi:hypothetical protein
MTERDPTKTELSTAQQNYYSDRPRIRTRRAALLDLLQDGQWHSNYELVKVGGLSFNSYLYKLRNAGWQIESRHIRGGEWQQRLVGKSEPRRREGLSRPQQRVADELAFAVRKVYGEYGWKRIAREFSPWFLDAVRAEYADVETKSPDDAKGTIEPQSDLEVLHPY